MQNERFWLRSRLHERLGKPQNEAAAVLRMPDLMISLGRVIQSQVEEYKAREDKAELEVLASASQITVRQTQPTRSAITITPDIKNLSIDGLYDGSGWVHSTSVVELLKRTLPQQIWRSEDIGRTTPPIPINVLLEELAQILIEPVLFSDLVNESTRA